MRKVITVGTNSFDTDKVKPDIQAIVAAFDRYLDDYPVKSAKSKHGVMGPVARILDRAKAGGYTEEALIGDAMRVHEMNPKARGYLSPVARQNLEDGTRRLLSLCRRVPTTSIVKVIDQIDYSLYYARRTKGIEWLEDKRKRFGDYLKERYTDDANLQRAWSKSKESRKLSLTNPPFPSRSSDDYLRRDPQRKADIDGFWESLGTDVGVEDDTEEMS